MGQGEPPAGNPCSGASLSHVSPDPPEEVQRGRVTLLLPGRGRGPRVRARDACWEARHSAGLGLRGAPRRSPAGACSAPAQRGRAQTAARSIGVQPGTSQPCRLDMYLGDAYSLASCACNACALPWHRWREV